MKSIVFQINKRYLTMRRAPLRFMDHIAENGECFIKNEDAVNEDEYLISLFVEGDNAKQRLRKRISIEDKTDLQKQNCLSPKMFLKPLTISLIV
jgi:tRNA(Phe) wybutosine-synthesizing methylase Tyw3